MAYYGSLDVTRQHDDHFRYDIDAGDDVLKCMDRDMETGREESVMNTCTDSEYDDAVSFSLSNASSRNRNRFWIARFALLVGSIVVVALVAGNISGASRTQAISSRAEEASLSTQSLKSVRAADFAAYVAAAGDTSACTTSLTEQSMEGNLELSSGDTVGAGYHINIPSPGGTVYVTNAAVTLHYGCSANGGAVGTIVMAFPDETFSGTGWQASNDQQSSLVWQIPSQDISAAIAACGGGDIWVNAQSGAASFSATIASSPEMKVNLQFHYRETSPKQTSGSWSATVSVSTCAMSPTSTPTETPLALPTPYPSFVPTDSPIALPTPAPSTTGLPSAVPSLGPTGVPSAVPTASPSFVPSQAPTPASSSTPSASPTALAPTALPTASPTYSSECLVTLTKQSMEGNLELSSGDTVGAGYHINIPSPGGTVYVTNAAVTLHYGCSANGGAVGTIVMAFPDETFSGTGWQASNDQQSSLVWQIPSQDISAAIAACGGGDIWVNAQSGAASFSATIASSPEMKVNLQFHYRETSPKQTSGSWSATVSVSTCAMSPTSTPTETPLALPTPYPSFVPTDSPIALPTPAPSTTGLPSAVPSLGPTALPSPAPTAYPTAVPSAVPSFGPTALPSPTPTAYPPAVPSAVPSPAPTASPSELRTAAPSLPPVAAPANSPTSKPTPGPTAPPAAVPTIKPTCGPSVHALQL
jgi:hypothetical protein